MKTKLRQGAALLISLLLVLGMALSAGTSATTTSKVRLRKGPGTKYSSIQTLSKGTSLTILETQKSWIKVRVGSKEGWVSADYVKTSSPTSTATAKATVKATATPKPTPMPTPDPETQEKMNLVISTVNAQRSAQIRTSLKADSTLNQKAQIRAKELASSFSHTRPDGSKVGPWLLKGDYTHGGELIAKSTGQDKAAITNLVNAWMDRPADMGNLLNANYKRIGAGIHKAADGTVYWVVLVTN